jgi:hypothetical protein
MVRDLVGNTLQGILEEESTHQLGYKKNDAANKIRCDMERNEIEVRDFVPGMSEIINPDGSSEGHDGGDSGIMRDFIEPVRHDGEKQGVTSADKSVQSHLMSLAAEKSRLENRVINIKDFIDELKGSHSLHGIPYLTQIL